MLRVIGYLVEICAISASKLMLVKQCCNETTKQWIGLNAINYNYRLVFAGSMLAYFGTGSSSCSSLSGEDCFLLFDFCCYYVFC